MTREEIVKASKDAEGGMYIVIPSVVRLDAELTLSARMLYGIITWKCNTLAYTWANNRELGELLGVSGKRVSELLSLLEKRGHVETEIEYKPGTKEVVRRYIYPIMKSSRGVLRADPPPKNKDTPPSEYGYLPPEIGGPPPKNTEVICNIKKENKNSSPYSPPDSPADCPGDGTPTEADSVDKPAGDRHSAAPNDRSGSLPAALDKPKRKRRARRSVPIHAPERFEQFWEAYPVGGSRLKAVEAWDALAPDDALIDEMARGLKRQMASRMWKEGIGIPHACRWIRDQRWTDKLPEEPKPRGSSGGWADMPGVRK